MTKKHWMTVSKSAFVLCLLVAFVIWGLPYIDKQKPQPLPTTATAGIGSLPNKTPVIVEVDDCEYVVIQGLYEIGICHKGNCKNPIHGGR